MRHRIWRRHDLFDRAFDRIALIFIAAVGLGLIAVPLAYWIGASLGAAD